MILANPPFGHAGSTALQHVEKFFKHLPDGGRIVTILPSGALEKLQSLIHKTDEKGNFVYPDMQLRRIIHLPGNVFQRAGTAVNTFVAVIDKTKSEVENLSPYGGLLRHKDDKTLGAFFDSLKELEDIVPPRPPSAETQERQAVPEQRQTTQRQETKREPQDNAPTFTLEPFTHTKTNEQKWLVKKQGYVSDEQFKRMRDQLKENNGAYSKFAGGFLFDNEADAKRFMEQQIGGNIYYSLKRDKENFKENIEAYKNGTLYDRSLITVISELPNIYRRIAEANPDLKFADNQLKMPARVFDKATGKVASTSTGRYHTVDIDSLLDLPENIHFPIMVLRGNVDNSIEILTAIKDKSGHSVIVAIHLKDIAKHGEINRIATIFGKDSTQYYFNKIRSGQGLYINKKKAANWSQSAGLAGFSEKLKSLSGEVLLKGGSPNIIIDDSDNASQAKDFSLKRHRQVNPIRESGEIRDQYGELIDTYYEVRGNEVVNREAEQRIAGNGGMNGTIRMMLDGDFSIGSDVSQRVMQVVLNSDEFKKLDVDERDYISNLYINAAGTDVARSLAARRIGVLDIADIRSIQAHVNAFMAKLDKKKPNNTLRKQIMEQFGFDIDNLPDDVVNNPGLLDEVIRRMSAERSSTFDKFYEYWINSILSAPTTHAANIIGNTANAAYELGLKRLAEAAINVVAKKKDAATFREFKEIVRAVNWSDAFQRAKRAFDLEALASTGKLEYTRAAIGGKLGRVVRMPGRLLKAADEFAKAVVQPMEAVAYAYRQGASQSLKGAELQSFIEGQLTKPGSKANAFGRQRALELTFQEDPGTAVKQLIQWREAGGQVIIAFRLQSVFGRRNENAETSDN